MSTYQIVDRVQDVGLGTFEGDDHWDALDAMARREGFEDFAAWCKKHRRGLLNFSLVDGSALVQLEHSEPDV